MNASNRDIVFFCSTKNFKQFTRRATIEAVSRLNKGASAVCLHSFWTKRGLVLESDFIKIYSYFYFFPLSLLKYSLFNRLNHFINKQRLRKLFSKVDVVCYTTPFQYHLLPFFRDRVNVFSLSDPYHLMNYSFRQESELLLNCSYIFATSKNLAQIYIDRYFSKMRINSRKIYWPNCVDLEVWHVDDTVKSKRSEGKVVIGFAGNFMKVTDIDLLKYIVLSLPNCQFVLAGKVEFKEGSKEYDEIYKIFNFENVEYKGLIKYSNLPKEVESWDICIMIDRKTEVASYHHHNKFYQYLAMGKPVVYQRNHDDYDHVEGFTYCSDSKEEFLKSLNNVISNIQHIRTNMNIAKDFAFKNSSDTRAKQFLNSFDII